MNSLMKSLLLSPFNLLYRISPELELKLMFRIKQRYRLDLKNPKTYNEKLQWIKLYDKNPLMPKCCDKYAVREYVEQCGCGEILNELYWQGFNPEEIPFYELPDKFVIKVTHGSTFNIVCKNKNELDKKKTISTLKRWLNAKFIPCYGEWFYGKENPRIVIEKFLEDSHTDNLYDYKVFCFNGEPKLIDVHSGRFGVHKRNIYNLNWKFLRDVNFKYEHDSVMDRPKVLEELLEYARRLSKAFNHARVDFFIVDNKIYFGEVTFTNGAGFDHITPHSFDLKMGSWMELSTNSKK